MAVITEQGYFGTPPVVKDGLVLYLDAGSRMSYAGSGTTWRDLSGNNYTASLFNTPIYTSSFQGGLVFDGTNQYGLISNPTASVSQTLTISMWVYPRTATQAITTLLDYDHTNAIAQGWVIQSEDATTNRNYYLAYYDGTNYQGAGAGSGIQVTSNAWQNITYTKTTTDNIRGYLNGIQKYTSLNTSTNISYQPGRNMGIAQTVSGSFTRYANIIIGTIQIYNGVLSQTEIVQNYNALKSRYGLQ